MGSGDSWQIKLKRQLLENIEELELEHSWWEQTAISGPLALMTYFRENRVKKRGGSLPGKMANIDRDRVAGHHRIWKDYFQDSPVYTDAQFRRRFCMRRGLFWKIHDAVVNHDPWFQQKRDATGVLGLSSIQKMTAALRQLSLGVSADALDEYCRIGESTAMESMKRFCTVVREVYEGNYLRQPTKSDLEKQFKINARRGFPGMFASIDCMHYVWKNCPVAWQGLFTNKDREKSIVLEAVADQSLWFWHAYFGLPGGNNDLNVLDRSPLVNNLLRSEANHLSFTVNGRQYDRYYLLADGIYPEWSMFVQTIPLPQSDAKKWFARCQEGARKDVERAFGVLQARWSIVVNPSRIHNPAMIKDILLACVILHNMIIEDEQFETLPQEWEQTTAMGVIESRRLPTSDWKECLKATKVIEDTEVHYMLRNDIVAHLWDLKGKGHRFDYVGQA